MLAGSTTDTTYYMGSFEYKNGELNQVFTEEGRIRYDETGDDYYYDYYLKDHLGNIRIVFTGDGNGNAEALQVNNYYPFGMRFKQASAVNKQDNSYLYNGKELQTFGLDWYDYGARFYDPELGRWHSIDPKAEKYYGLTPYNYVANNPILLLDPDGEEIWIYYGEERKNKIQYKNGKLYDEEGNEVDVENDFVNQVVDAIDELKETDTGEWLTDELQNSDKKHDIYKTDEGSYITAKDGLASYGLEEGGSGSSIYWNSGEKGSFIGLGHEMAHGWDMQNGQFDWMNGIWLKDVGLRERRACHIENIIRNEYGLQLRKSYSGTENTKLINKKGKEIILKYDYKNNPNVERNYGINLKNAPKYK